LKQRGQSPGSPGQEAGGSTRKSGRKEARERGRTVWARPEPPPLPPHPEGLRPPVWPPLATLVALVTFLAGVGQGNLVLVVAAGAALGLIVLYATFTRNDPKKQLLYAYIQGRRQFMMGDYEAALANFKDMEEADFSPPAVVRAIGLTSYRLEEWSDTATYLEDVPDRTPDEDAVLAHALVELGDFDGALEVLDHAERETPLARVMRAVVLIKKGRAREAAGVLEAVIEESGGEQAPAAEPYLGARYWLGVAFRETGDEENARKVFAELEELSPGYRDAASSPDRQGGGGES